MNLLLAQYSPTPRALPVTADVNLIAGILIACLVVGVAWYLWSRQQRTAADDRFLGLADLPGTKVVHGEELKRVAQRVQRVFCDMHMYARHQTILGAYRYEADGFDVTVAHLVLGLERSNANHQTLDKVVVLVEGFPGGLPEFSLTPSNFLMRKIHRRPVFEPINRFGVRNMVRSSEPAAVRSLFTDEAQTMFRDNRNTAVDSRDDLLAFFLHDEQVIPRDMPAFLRDAVAFAHICREQAAVGAA